MTVYVSSMQRYFRNPTEATSYLSSWLQALQPKSECLKQKRVQFVTCVYISVFLLFFLWTTILYVAFYLFNSLSEIFSPQRFVELFFVLYIVEQIFNFYCATEKFKKFLKQYLMWSG